MQLPELLVGFYGLIRMLGIVMNPQGRARRILAQAQVLFRRIYEGVRLGRDLAHTDRSRIGQWNKVGMELRIGDAKVDGSRERWVPVP